MRHAKRHCLSHARMRHQHFINFQRSNFFSAAIDQFFDARCQVQIAIGINRALIAGAEPSIGK